MNRPFRVVLWLSVLITLSMPGCGEEQVVTRPDLDLIQFSCANCDGDSLHLSVSLQTGVGCGNLDISVVNGTDRAITINQVDLGEAWVYYTDNRMVPAFAAAWLYRSQLVRWTERIEAGQTEVIYGVVCLDLPSLFLHDPNMDGKKFCEALRDAQGIPISIVGEMSLGVRLVLFFRGFDEYGSEFGPNGPQSFSFMLLVECHL